MTIRDPSHGGVQKLSWKQPNAGLDYFEVELSKDIWLCIQKKERGRWSVELAHVGSEPFHEQTIKAASIVAAEKLAERRAAEWFEKHSARLLGGR